MSLLTLLVLESRFEPGANMTKSRSTSALDADELALMHAIRHSPRSRAELAEMMGWSRNTVVAKLAGLIEAGWVTEFSELQAGRGRPFARYAVNPAAATTFIAGFDVESVTAAICQIDGTILAWERQQLPAVSGPDAAVMTLDDMLKRMTGKAGIPRQQIEAMVVAANGPVSDMRVTVPWSKVGVLPSDFSAHFGMKVAVENDANIVALGVQRENPQASSVLALLVETGIGAGIVFSGQLNRGFSGWAGEVGHIPVAAAGDTPCVCGNRGCVASIASNPALIRSISTKDRPLKTVDDLRGAVISGDTDAIMALRQAGRHIGEAITGLVIGLAPDIISVGGSFAKIGDHLIAGIRESLSQRTPPAISSHLRILGMQDHNRSGIRGASEIAFDLLFPR